MGKAQLPYFQREHENVPSNIVSGFRIQNDGRKTGGGGRGEPGGDALGDCLLLALGDDDTST
jgi:hypothetical protein